ncbi:helix-turn-helix domain-containing protein [Mycolicibacter virginiensis]|uniref:Helix-turn-helix domain-containing protein n=1 Tax=Mycolicibacter virginiensis TaxID=1795032 RepID=A0A9X7IN02_9MYCO|nr:helix-turn-helix domain-containing protein [Mycolicibacter virginiensis]PQM52036.1 hypothetical protein C5U48_11775 [Mycolicibacter virginiensis]ULP47334.1 helix-turn-helix domain-containing protein [Mycolicibacter virginiensis]
MTHNPEGPTPSLEVRIAQRITADGSAIISPRMARWLDRKSGMTEDRRINLRTTDPDAYVALTALHISACYSGNGTEPTAAQPNTAQSEMLMTTTAAAQALNVTDRCIRKWCAAGKLHARRVGGRWLIDSNSITALKATA